MADEQLQHIIDKAIQGDELPFNRFFKNTYQTLFPKLLVFTKSKEVVEEIYIVCMQKFWECFVMNRQDLPHNSTGYIYIMCKNYWLLSQKQQKKTVFFEDVPQELQKIEKEEEPNEIPFTQSSVSEDEFVKHKALSMALETLSSKCKELMEADLDPKIQLKSLQETFGYSNYQALVQAKYNCKKRLVKKVYEILHTLQKSSSTKA